MVRGFFLRWWNVLKVSKNVLKSWWYLHNSVNILKTIELYTLNRGHIWYVRGFPGSAVVKNPPVNAGDTRDAGLIPGLQRSPGGNGNPLQYSCLGNSMNKGAWWATVHGVAKSWTQLSTLIYFLALWIPLFWAFHINRIIKIVSVFFQ